MRPLVRTLVRFFERQGFLSQDQRQRTRQGALIVIVPIVNEDIIVIVDVKPRGWRELLTPVSNGYEVLDELFLPLLIETTHHARDHHIADDVARVDKEVLERDASVPAAELAFDFNWMPIALRYPCPDAAQTVYRGGSITRQPSRCR